MSDANVQFRVHFADGTKIVIIAATAEQARHAAKKRNDTPITKIKIAREVQP